MDAEDRDAPLMALDQYMRWVRQIPYLTEEEEAVLLRRLERGAYERKQVSPDAWRLHLGGSRK